MNMQKLNEWFLKIYGPTRADAGYEDHKRIVRDVLTDLGISEVDMKERFSEEILNSKCWLKSISGSGAELQLNELRTTINIKADSITL